MCCFLVFWNDICVSSKTAQCIGNNVGFAGLVFDLEAVSLNGENPSNNAVCR